MSLLVSVFSNHHIQRQFSFPAQYGMLNLANHAPLDWWRAQPPRAVRLTVHAINGFSGLPDGAY